jgi:hypothetical protein
LSRARKPDAIRTIPRLCCGLSWRLERDVPYSPPVRNSHSGTSYATSCGRDQKVFAGYLSRMNCESAPLGPLDKAPVQIDVVAGVCGLDTSQYSIGYIANWSDGDSAMIKNTAEHVLSTSRTIIDLLTPEQELKVAAERPAAAEYVVRTDPMDELQCDSCQ